MDGRDPPPPLFNYPPPSLPSPARQSLHLLPQSSPRHLPLPLSSALLPDSVRPGERSEAGEAREMTTLGKRHRNNSSLRRTTSMSGFAVPAAEEEAAGRQPTRAAPAPTEWGAASAAFQRRHSGDFHAVVETAAFLKACGLCCRRLGPGRDTFIYMGEVAFCSLECRQQQMNLDELKDKKCFPATGSGGSDGTSGTVAAA